MWTDKCSYKNTKLVLHSKASLSNVLAMANIIGNVSILENISSGLLSVTNATI